MPAAAAATPAARVAQDLPPAEDEGEQHFPTLSAAEAARRSAFTPQQVAAWFRDALGAAAGVAEMVEEEEIDGAVMDTVVSITDRNTLADLGVAGAAEQDRALAAWRGR